MRELADGTLRVQIDIDPPHRAAFLTLFSEIDCRVALARMQPEHVVRGGGNAAPAGEPDAAPATVSLCALACMWCRDPAFQAWLELVYPQEWSEADTAGDGPERVAGRVVRRVCGVASRKELDTNQEAARDFDALIREPWMAGQ